MIVVIALLVGLAAAAHAGSKFVLGVFIDTNGHIAQGAISDARNSADSTSRIQCQLGASAAGLGMACYAMDANSVFATCFSSNPTFAQAIAAIQSDTFVEFRWDDAGNCTSVLVSQDSATGPKQP
jgi:hypothetical protein